MHAEVMALLQVLRTAPLDSNPTVYIDNTGVIENWMGREGYGGRLSQGARAIIWNRIYMLSQTREDRIALDSFTCGAREAEDKEQGTHSNTEMGVLMWG